MLKTTTWLGVLAASVLLACGGGGSAPAASEAPRIEANEIAEALADADVILLDVREPEELEELGTIEGYVNIPIDQLADRLDELPRDKRILTA
ncbi:MAG TPA: rhodanese-like domain-containing protein [Vicinamibacteria bacterium]|nr:rhodanese-like domain-containing protein [Vicinamibacteria bacterium]